VHHGARISVICSLTGRAERSTMKRCLKTLLAGCEDYSEAVAWSCKAADPENTRPLAHRTPRFAVSIGGALDAPATAFIYDWNMLPIGQQLWLKGSKRSESFPQCRRWKATTCRR
jgi:hypothetical protein